MPKYVCPVPSADGDGRVEQFLPTNLNLTMAPEVMSEVLGEAAGAVVEHGHPWIMPFTSAQSRKKRAPAPKSRSGPTAT